MQKTVSRPASADFRQPITHRRLVTLIELTASTAAGDSRTR